eukprot:SAG31_NODE_5019_length_2799_cov_2.490000_1_plen_473_part_10
MLLLLLMRAASGEISLGASPMGWEDFDSHTNAGYNESYARKVAAVQISQLLPSGYDTFIIGGWSMGGQVLPNGTIPHYINNSRQYTLLDEYGRREYPADATRAARDKKQPNSLLACMRPSSANPDGVRFPSAMVGAGAADCECDTRNCTIAASTDCTDPVCVCKAATRSLRPFAEFLNGLGLRLGLWTWRGVHRMAAVHKLKVKGTDYTIDQIVDQNRDGTPCLTGRCSGRCPWGPWLGVNASHPGAQAFYDSLYELFITEWKVEFVKADCEDSTRLGETLAQTNAVKKQPLISGVVSGSTKPRTMALSLSPGTFGPTVESGRWIAQNQAATMYRVTTDFWGGQGQVFGSLAGGGGSVARASLHANASLLGNQAGSNGTYPDLVRAGPTRLLFVVVVRKQQCDCCCHGTGYVTAWTDSLWSGDCATSDVQLRQLRGRRDGAHNSRCLGNSEFSTTFWWSATRRWPHSQPVDER